jgi:hypothetical protein
MLRAGIVQKHVLPVDAAVQTGDLLLDSQRERAVEPTIR